MTNGDSKTELIRERLNSVVPADFALSERSSVKFNDLCHYLESIELPLRDGATPRAQAKFIDTVGNATVRMNELAGHGKIGETTIGCGVCRGTQRGSRSYRTAGQRLLERTPSVDCVVFLFKSPSSGRWEIALLMYREGLEVPAQVLECWPEATLIAVSSAVSDLSAPQAPTVESEADSTLGAIPQALADSLLLPQQWLDEARRMLNSRKQVIFHGPPGTGKTFVARKLAAALAHDASHVSLVQFHPSFAYEDFVEGYRPINDDGALTYELAPGAFKRACLTADDNPDSPVFVIIDEINRARPEKVLGELLFALEYRDSPVQLQYSPEESFELPANLYIIGTMNTSDRSIALVDMALRRRFYFKEFDPRVDPVSGVLERWETAIGRPSDAPAYLRRLNEKLDAEGLGTAIGPSYFMSRDSLDDVFEWQLRPLLDELLYGSGAESAEFSPGALL
jgi:hypothetical protein